MQQCLSLTTREYLYLKINKVHTGICKNLVLRRKLREILSRRRQSPRSLGSGRQRIDHVNLCDLQTLFSFIFLLYSYNCTMYSTFFLLRVKLFLSKAPKVYRYLFYVDSTLALTLPCFGWHEPMPGVKLLLSNAPKVYLFLLIRPWLSLCLALGGVNRCPV